MPLNLRLLAEIDSETRSSAAELAGMDEALALSAETGEHFFDSEFHRIRGEILLKQSPDDPALAEADFQTASAIAQSQQARSFELRATLSLAKFTARRAAKPTPTRRSGRRSTASRQRRSFRRSKEAIELMPAIKAVG
jgi:predicted ATPase